MNEPLRIGVLGAARITERALVGPARTTGHRLVAVAARDRARAGAFAAQHGVERVLDSYAALVNDPEVEAVYNPLANSLHGPWNLAAIAAGKHVLTEKPFASNAEEAAEVRDAAAAAGVVIMEGFHYLFHPVTRRLHELLASGELGEPRHVETELSIPAPPEGDPRWDSRPGRGMGARLPARSHYENGCMQSYALCGTVLLPGVRASVSSASGQAGSTRLGGAWDEDSS
jgi:predicted dehydrogenase